MSTEFTDEEMAEYRRSDAHKMDAAEELLGNLGWSWDSETGEWS